MLTLIAIITLIALPIAATYDRLERNKAWAKARPYELRWDAKAKTWRNRKTGKFEARPLIGQIPPFEV